MAKTLYKAAIFDAEIPEELEDDIEVLHLAKEWNLDPRVVESMSLAYRQKMWGYLEGQTIIAKHKQSKGA